MKYLVTVIAFLSMIIPTFSIPTCNTCINPLRIMVLMDGSGTVNDKNFQIGKDALVNLLDTIGTDISSEMGVIRFSSRSQVIVKSTSNYTKLRTEIENMEYTGGWTNTKSAIKLAGKINEKQWNDNNTTRILLIITDGLPQLNENTESKKREMSKTIQVMDDFKDMYPDVDVISITIGKKFKSSALFFKKISDFPVYLAKDYNELSELFGNLSVNICKDIDIISNKKLLYFT